MFADSTNKNGPTESRAAPENAGRRIRICTHYTNPAHSANNHPVSTGRYNGGSRVKPRNHGNLAKRSGRVYFGNRKTRRGESVRIGQFCADSSRRCQAMTHPRSEVPDHLVRSGWSGVPSLRSKPQSEGVKKHA